jgi:hypothetical protein
MCGVFYCETIIIPRYEWSEIKKQVYPLWVTLATVFFSTRP